MSAWLDAAAIEVVPSGPLSTAVRAPASKSVTNRAILIAALADGTSRLQDALFSDDTRAMCRAVSQLGATCSSGAGGVTVEGTGGRISPAGPVDAGLSGTTMRFVTAAAALSATDVEVGGSTPLLRRPIGPLTAALRDLGARASDHAGFPPVTVGGGLGGGEVEVDVSTSSQYLSAVLLAAPYAEADVVATAAGQSADAYIALTADLMQRWGAEVVQEDVGRWRVAAGRHYTARDEVMEYDASAAAHLLALAAASAGSVTVTNAAPATLQPDARLPQVLAAMGCTVREEEGAVSVLGPDHLSGVAVNLSAMPDQVTTVAALAAVADGRTEISGVGVTRGHETDRLSALAVELSKLGVGIDEQPERLTIQGGARGPARLATHGDHRLAMAFAAIGVRVAGITIEDPGCVAKTYPGFWDDLVASGVQLRQVG